MKNLAKALLWTGFAVISASAVAGPITLSDFTNSASVINFDALNSAQATGPFTLGVVTFSESSTGSGSAGWRLFNAGTAGNANKMLTDNAGISNIRLDFATNYNRVGFHVAVGGNYLIDFYSGTNLLGTQNAVVTDALSQFIGFEDLSGGVSRAVIRETNDNGRVGGLWNVRYENVTNSTVPEPATLALTLSALAGIAVARRKRRA